MGSHLVDIKVTLNTKQFEVNSDNAAASAKSLRQQVDVAFGGIITKATAVSVAYNQIDAATQRAMAVVSKLVGPIVSAQDEMANVATLGVADLEGLNTQVQDLGQEMVENMTSLRRGLYQVISVDVDDLARVDVLEAATMAAKVGQTDVNQAVSLGANFIKAYGKAWDETDEILGKAAITQELGATTIAEIAANAGKAIPTLAQLGVVEDQVFGITAAAAGVTGSTAEVYTQLKAVATGLIKPKKELADLIQKETGLTVEQFIAQKQLIGLLELLRTATGGSAAAMGKFFESSEALTLLLPATGALFEDIKTKTAAMKNGAEALTEKYQGFTETLSGQAQILENRWTVVVEKASASLLPFANNVLGAAIEMMDARSEATRLADAIEAVGKKVKETDTLDEAISRYEALSSKANLTTQEQEDLRKVTDQIAKVFPDAVTAVDSYGKALSLSIPHVKNMIDHQRAMLMQSQNAMFETARERLARYIRVVAEYPVEHARANEALRQSEERLKSYEEELNRAQEAHDTAKVLQWRQSLDDARALVEKNTHDIDSLTAAQKEGNKEIQHNLNLLYGFTDLTSVEFIDDLTEAYGLNDQELTILNERLVRYKQNLDAAQAAQQNAAATPIVAAVDVDPVLPKIDIPNPDQEIVLPARVVAGVKITDDSVKGFEAAIDKMIETNKLRLDAGLIDEQDYNARRYEIYLSAADELATMGTEYQDLHLGILAELGRMDTEVTDKQIANAKRAADNKREQDRQVMHAAGEFAVALFGQTKAAQYAAAIINTAEAVTAVLPNIPLAALIAAKGAVQIATIAATDIEQKKEGGPLDGSGRVLERGDYGAGENRLIIANSREYIVNGDTTARNRAALDAANFGGYDLVAVPSSAGAVVEPALSKWMRDGGFVGVDAPPLYIPAEMTPSIGGQQMPFTGMPAPTSGITEKQFKAFQDSMVEAIENIQIQITGTLDAMQFYRDTFPKYSRTEQDRKF